MSDRRLAPDQRRHARRAAAARVCVWIDDQVFEGKLVETSTQGLRVAGIPGELFTIRQRYRISVESESSGEFACTAEVRHIGNDGVGMETNEVLPDFS